jgi:V/A-type H+-transporting ATPase subunit I
LAGKAITGLVSLYGIMGSYGCLSFLGDTLSYSRLLALGLTTTIIGMSFNIMAGLLKQVPVVGIGLFVALLVLGHMFNFAVSIIGSFVHPARLIFLEFFSRFYESGGTKFTPLSADNERVLVSES